MGKHRNKRRIPKYFGGLIIGAILAMAFLLLWLLFSQRGNRVLNGIKEYFVGAYLPEGKIYGIDVSHYQGDINWAQVSDISYDPLLKRVSKKGSRHKPIAFAIAKATEGSNGHYDDDTFITNSTAIRAKGLKFGAYHVLTPSGKFDDQARRFIEKANLKSGDIRPILDVENDIRLKGKELVEAVKSWIGIVEKYYSCKPIIYTSNNLYVKTFDIEEFKEYDFWIAQYNNPTVDAPCVMWQFTSRGVIKGIKGRVDLNVLSAKLSDMSTLLIP